MLLSKLAVLLAALQLLFVSAEGATVTSGSCVQEYQATLRKAASIRETCEGAAFYDCCQVCACHPTELLHVLAYVILYE